MNLADFPRRMRIAGRDVVITYRLASLLGRMPRRARRTWLGRNWRRVPRYTTPDTPELLEYPCNCSTCRGLR